MLPIVLVMVLAWNSFILNRAYAHLDAAGLLVISTSSLADRIRANPGLILRPGAWGIPKDWRGQKRVGPRDDDTEILLRNLDAIAPALRSIQPDEINLRGSPLLENVDGLSGLDSVHFLYLDRCSALQDLNGLSSMSSLELLTASHCSSLRNVDGIKGLTGLRKLHLDGSKGIPAAALRELRIALPTTNMSLPDGTYFPSK